jgi:hypothetical protein
MASVFLDDVNTFLDVQGLNSHIHLRVFKFRIGLGSGEIVYVHWTSSSKFFFTDWKVGNDNVLSISQRKLKNLPCRTHIVLYGKFHKDSFPKIKLEKRIFPRNFR